MYVLKLSCRAFQINRPKGPWALPNWILATFLSESIFNFVLSFKDLFIKYLKGKYPILMNIIKFWKQLTLCIPSKNENFDVTSLKPWFCLISGKNIGEKSDTQLLLKSHRLLKKDSSKVKIQVSSSIQCELFYKENHIFSSFFS